jgi:hypothetical protein
MFKLDTIITELQSIFEITEDPTIELLPDANPTITPIITQISQEESDLTINRIGTYYPITNILQYEIDVTNNGPETSTTFTIDAPILTGTVYDEHWTHNGTTWTHNDSAYNHTTGIWTVPTITNEGIKKLKLNLIYNLNLVSHPTIWKGGVDIAANNKPTLYNGPKLLLGLIPYKYKEGVGGRSTLEITIVMAGLIEGTNEASKLKAYRYADIMFDEIMDIKNGVKSEWTTLGTQIRIKDANPAQIMDFKLNEQAEKPDCSGFAMTFTIIKTGE